ncbi:ABC transporter ATP-binding protein [Neobacillus niacini]|uniref:ABC transporter ATP-binding protein n=1 Tax=Neobacillus niacini TaxID=86668 RepID=UPI002FFFE9DD
MPQNKTLLEVKKLGKRFGGNWAIKDVDISINQNEIIGVIGPNGAGKTTLFNMMTGFLKPTEGEVFLRNKDITNLESHQICKKGVSRTFQIVKPFSGLSVLDNVMVGVLNKENNVSKARKRAKEYIDLVGLSAFIDAPASSLPLGNRKRLEVARAVATDPEVIMLDEVMGGLNDDETVEMMDIIKKLHKEGLTILLIEHNMHALMTLSERVVVLCYGEKLAEGTPKEVSSNQKVIEAYLGSD